MHLEIGKTQVYIDDEKYYETAFKLSNAFRENFKKFESYANEEIRRGGPQRFAY